MSEQSLKSFLERINNDESFREQLIKDPEGVLAELSPAEQVAIASDDEDALRRLVGDDVEGYGRRQRGFQAAQPGQAANLSWSTILCNSKYICWTAGSKKHCGTGGACRTTAGSGTGCGTGGRCNVAR